MALEIEAAYLTWRVIEGGNILARVFVQFNEDVILTGIPDWQLIDGLGNDHKCIWATPHIKPTDDIVDFVVGNFHAQPAFDVYQLRVAGADPAVQTPGFSKIPGGDYPLINVT